MRSRLAPLILAGCAAATPAPSSPPSGAGWIPEDAATGVAHEGLARLLEGHWAWQMERAPRWATQIGIRRFDARIEDTSPAAIAKQRAETREWLAKAKALSGLDPASEDTRALLVEELESAIESEVCRFDEWTLNPRWNPITEWNYLPELHKVSSIEDGQNLVARYRQIARSIDESIALLRKGAADGLIGNAESARRVAEMVKKQLAQPMEKWPLVAPVDAEHPGWPESVLEKLRHDIASITAKDVKPAFERYLAVLEEEIIPKSRSDERPGLAALPLGGACYEAQIRAYTQGRRAAKEIHEVGLAESARIDEEMQALGAKLFGAKTLTETLARLRSDPALNFDAAEEVEAKARSALAAAKAKMGDFFGVLPKADCVVVPIPEYEAPYTTVAYYRPPVPDGSKPGEYFINTYAPKTRTRYEAEALAFHEAIPGHHLQIAIAQELPALPAFRKHLSMTAFVEGWALYSERLSDEMGLYTGDLDRLGMLSYEAWRASRLVVDTGIHAMGWSREQAKRFMLEHTALAANNVDNEVDRYITWPGQALAYKLGQLEILRLRAHAEAALGPRFDLREFHDVILGAGAVTLEMVARRVDAWIARRRG